MPKCRQVSAAFRPCSSYHCIIRNRCLASFDSSRARTALTERGMFSQKFLIPPITQVYGIYLNEITSQRAILPHRGLSSRRRARSWLPMTEALAGKWVWVWNWRRCDGGDPAKVAARLRTAGCHGALIKAHDGPHWFDQGPPWREIAAALKAEGLAIGGWAYLYGRDPAGEARLVGETVSYGGADLIVLDVEAEFEGQPQAAQGLCRRVREAVG